MNADQLYEITGYRAIPVICGPTASGKTSLSIRIAQQAHAEICCCDSMQIYRHLSVGTAKPTNSEQVAVSHHLIDLVEPDVAFNVASYLEVAYGKIDELLKQQKLPVFCGGTGLYVQALQKGISFDQAPVDSKIEDDIRKEYEAHGINDIYQRLISLDPACKEKIHPNNTKRVIHTLALLTSLQTTTKDIREASVKEGPRYPFRLFCIDWPREVLYQRINLRVDQMMKEGILEEAQWLFNQHYDSSCTVMQAIGYKEFFPYFQGESTLEDCVEILKQHTRNYAKRQLTWFRHMDDITWINGEDLSNYNASLFLEQ